MDAGRFQRVKEIFADAVNLSGAERAARLDEACAGDADLRAEVEALLASDEKAAAGPLAQALAEAPSEEGSKTHSTGPGDMIAGRYRIVAPLGRGGMGEVYLAEDLKLGQQVALKFLSEHTAARPGGMERFLDEVRVARRVGHPNVARVHDVGEADGRHFLSMEYVSGEDLSRLLKRIGRLPREKAQEIARQLCAGLDAIHSTGILHRDLKPANVMLDGDGNVRITDFGLAQSARAPEASVEVAGTPAYMAPEQFEGRPATERSEIFSLGLLLYEVFTGRRAFKGRTFLELKAEYAEEAPSPPSSVITDFDPEVEEAILRCLQKDPGDRPQSVRAVALSLPGGDPLAAAVAAGETPAPQVVANAPDTRGMSPWMALSCLAGVVVLVALTLMLQGRVYTSLPPYSADVLIKEARDFLDVIGHDIPRRDSIHMFVSDLDEVPRGQGPSDGADAGDAGVGGTPDRLFWYRESPVEIVKRNQFLVGADWDDPPHDVPGMVRMRMTTRGALRSFSRVPAAERATGSREPPDWTPFFQAAGLAGLRRESVEARWSHDVHADAVYAWELRRDEDGEGALRVEAASAGGVPVSFLVTRKAPPPVFSLASVGEAIPDNAGFAADVQVLLGFVILLGLVVLAWRNLRAGRGDRRGAVRVGLFLFAVMVIGWVGFAHHSSRLAFELTNLRLRFATALWYATLAVVAYLAIEPYFRRLWPQRLVSWVRLLDGRWRDPLVGRDLLVGALLGTVFSLLFAVYSVARPDELDVSTGARLSFLRLALHNLSGASHSLVSFVLHVRLTLQFALKVVGTAVLLRLLLRKPAPTVAALCAVLFLSNLQYYPGWEGYLLAAVFAVLEVVVLLRIGILAVCVMLYVLFVVDMTLPLTPGAWYAGYQVPSLLTIALIAGWGFRVTTAGRPLFRDPLSSP